jgi:TonB-linked SusC/RagA family outer membrane protein
MKVIGTISDTNGNVIPSANVHIKGTTTGVQSDFDGVYTILVDKGQKLEFSYLGMKTQTQTVENNKLDVILQDDLLGLDEVIITGTSGLAKKKQLGSSISTVNSKNLSAAKANVSIGEALQGHIAGAKINRNSGDPSGGMSITLRGASSLTGSTDPLIIMDGVIISNASSSLVNLGGNTQNRLVDINPDDIERVEVLKGAAAAAIYGSLASNGVVQFFTKRGKSGKPRISYSTSVNTNSIRETLPYNTAQLKWEDDGSGNLIAVPATRYNYQDYIFTNSTGFENALSISGGKDKTKYLVSFSQYKNEGIVRNTDFARKSIRVRLDQQLYSWLDLSVGSYFSGNKSNDIPNGTNYGPITSLLFADNLNDAAPDELGNYANIGWMANPYEAIDKVNASQEYFRSISDIQLKTRPFKGAAINYTFGIDNSNGEGLLYIPRGFNTKPNGVSEKNTSKNFQYNSDLNASYNFNINENLRSTTGAGISYLSKKSDYFSMKNNQVGPVPGVIVVSPDVVTGGGDIRTEYSVWGSFLQQTFAYKDQLFVTAAARIDGSSLFGKDDRQQFYPKLSASYNISDADFWGDSKYINTLKLRTAWGQTGNLTAITPYSLTSNYDSN